MTKVKESWNSAVVLDCLQRRWGTVHSVRQFHSRELLLSTKRHKICIRSIVHSGPFLCYVYPERSERSLLGVDALFNDSIDAAVAYFPALYSVPLAVLSSLYFIIWIFLTAYDSWDIPVLHRGLSWFIHLPLWRRSVTVPHLCTERSEFMASANAPIASSASSACQVLFSIPTIADNCVYGWLLQISIYSGFFQTFRIDALRLWRQSLECIIPKTPEDKWRWSRHTTKDTKGKTFTTPPATRWCGACLTRWRHQLAPPVLSYSVLTLLRPTKLP